MRNNIENLLELSKLALVFYANPDNYKTTLVHEKGLIHSDMGTQARFALNEIEAFHSNDNLSEELDMEINSIANDESYSGYFELMNELLKKNK